MEFITLSLLCNLTSDQQSFFRRWSCYVDDGQWALPLGPIDIAAVHRQSNDIITNYNEWLAIQSFIWHDHKTNIHLKK